MHSCCSLCRTPPHPPRLRRHPPHGGFTTTINNGTTTDVLIRNDDSTTVTTNGIITDAHICVVRRINGTPVSYIATGMTTLSIDGTLYAEVLDAPAGCALAGTILHIDRADAQFRFLDTSPTELRYGEQTLGFVGDGNGYLVSDGVTAVPEPGPVRRHSHSRASTPTRSTP